MVMLVIMVIGRRPGESLVCVSDNDARGLGGSHVARSRMANSRVAGSGMAHSRMAPHWVAARRAGRVPDSVGRPLLPWKSRIHIGATFLWKKTSHHQGTPIILVIYNLFTTPSFMHIRRFFSSIFHAVKTPSRGHLIRRISLNELLQLAVFEETNVPPFLLANTGYAQVPIPQKELTLRKKLSSTFAKLGTSNVSKFFNYFRLRTNTSRWQIL